MQGGDRRVLWLSLVLERLLRRIPDDTMPTRGHTPSRIRTQMNTASSSLGFSTKMVDIGPIVDHLGQPSTSHSCQTLYNHVVPIQKNNEYVQYIQHMRPTVRGRHYTGQKLLERTASSQPFHQRSLSTFSSRREIMRTKKGAVMQRCLTYHRDRLHSPRSWTPNRIHRMTRRDRWTSGGRLLGRNKKWKKAVNGYG
jgi:hypothetical protein